jgi:hypothetical protein
MEHEDILDFVRENESIADLFKKAHENGYLITSVDIVGYDFKALETRTDFAIVELHWVRPEMGPPGGIISTMKEHPAQDVFVHPYGSGIGYEFSQS